MQKRFWIGGFRLRIYPNKHYKIRRISDGKFKKGGVNTNFTTGGKVWKGSLVKTHLRQFAEYRTGEMREGFSSAGHPFEDYEIVEYDLMETDSQNLKDFIEEEMK